MNKVRSFLGRQWEKVTFWCITLLFVVTLLLWFTGFGHEGPSGAATHSAPQQIHFLNPAMAFAFRDELPPLAMKNPNPFFFVVRPAVRTPRFPPRDPPPVEVKTVPQVVAVPVKPTVNQLVIEYMGTITSVSGKKLAMLRNRNSGETAAVQVGATFSKYKITSFSPKEAIAEDAKGAEITFALGQQTRIPLE